jgi:transcriptional regulator
MYQPPHFREDRLDVLHGLIRANPLGAIVTMGADGLTANHVPFLIDEGAGPFGTLRAHFARANPQWREFDGEREALVIFQGADAYITPSWYPLKAETGKVVPTWNYAIVHAHGRPRAIEDRDWLLHHISQLTDANEADRAEPWAVSDAPADFVAGLMKGIVGIEIEITRIEGKWKASQNRSEADRAGVVEGLTLTGDDRSRGMATMVPR